MKQCTHCGRESDQTALACGGCGTPLPESAVTEPVKPLCGRAESFATMQVPPMLGPSTTLLSSSSRLYPWLYKWATGEHLCRCEWRADGICFDTRNGQTLVPLSEISAFWRREYGNLRIYEIQLKNKELPQWRFVFASSFWVTVDSAAIRSLRNAIQEANPDASIVPQPTKPGLLARFGLDWTGFRR